MAFQHSFSWSAVRLPVEASLTEVRQVMMSPGSSNSSSSSSSKSSSAVIYAKAVQTTLQMITADLELHRWLADPEAHGKSSTVRAVQGTTVSSAASALYAAACARLPAVEARAATSVMEFNKIMGKQGKYR